MCEQIAILNRVSEQPPRFFTEHGRRLARTTGFHVLGHKRFRIAVLVPWVKRRKIGLCSRVNVHREGARECFYGRDMRNQQIGACTWIPNALSNYAQPLPRRRANIAVAERLKFRDEVWLCRLRHRCESNVK